jgi:general stress protein 26
MTNSRAGSVERVAELAKGIRIAMLTTMDADGDHLSRPMAQQEVEFDGDLWFFSARDSRKIGHIAANPRVNVALTSNDTWISIHGSAVVVDDPAKKKELWNGFVDAWFRNGPEDPDVVLIKVEADGAEYWDTPGGRVAQAVSFVKMKLTGAPYDGGENERVDL